MKKTHVAPAPKDWREQVLYDALVKSCPHPLRPPVHDELLKLAAKRLTQLGMGDDNVNMLWTSINADLKAAGKPQVPKAEQVKCDTVGDCLAAIVAATAPPSPSPSPPPPPPAVAVASAAPAKAKP